MKPYYADEKSSIYCGNCRLILPELEADSVDSIVTDPPYELGFMGKSWDSTGIAYDVNLWRECLRVLKPGGHILSFGGSRTYHRMACAIEDAGFEVRDQIMWIYGSGFPKSHNLKGEWDGWGTALKPAHEPICVARKPLMGTVAVNMSEFGTGALNIDGCRIKTTENLNGGVYANNGSPRHDGTENWRYKRDGSAGEFKQPAGRWPANIIHDGSEEVLDCFPQTHSGAMRAGTVRAATDHPGSVCYGTYGGNATEVDTFGDSGSAARFFYTAKADRWDRNEGCDALDAKPPLWSSGTKNPGSFQAEGTDRSSKNNHPTVKPTALMRYLCRLVTRPGGLVLDPFMGSGSTRKAALKENLRFIGMELEERYCEIASRRLPQEVLDFSGTT